ncbi:SDR family NAD(P)-dependent oxidoreductase [Zavarzinia sp. CC-PAN008]|uniref:SDR family NAD(P)-dependent oxidoreductase n=1 Tax=Zavarzinia sp. CC-PAN008 TaxID=3243332 RepID=UPI003F7447C3
MDKVIVITGASSGIGRATAHALARRGARMVLVARRSHLLDQVTEECRRLGGTAIAATADVNDGVAMNAAVDRAIHFFGGVDVWINNAGVMMAHGFEDAPATDFRQVIETNFFGYVNGIRAVLPHFKARRRGIIINNAALVGRTGQVRSSAYVASKFAVRGLSIALRQELRSFPGIHVCSILPSTIDTPLFQHAANHTGKALRPGQVTGDAAAVARQIVGLIDRPRREIVAGPLGGLASLFHTLFPDTTEKGSAAMDNLWEKLRDGSRKQVKQTSGALYRPVLDRLAVSGNWRRAPSARTTALVAVGVVAVPALLYLASKALPKARDRKMNKRLAGVSNPVEASAPPASDKPSAADVVDTQAAADQGTTRPSLHTAAANGNGAARH